DAEGLAGELGQVVPDCRPLERARERDAGLDALLVCCGAGSVVATQAHAPDGYFFGRQILSRRDPVADRLRRALVVAADRDLVLGFPLSRPIDREHRDAAREEG